MPLNKSGWPTLRTRRRSSTGSEDAGQLDVVGIDPEPLVEGFVAWILWRIGSVRMAAIGANDPYPLLLTVADAPGGGHLNGEAGFVTFPQIRDTILATRLSIARQDRG